MSTTIKRVALVAVAALGLGVVSVAPSQAAAQLDSISVSASTATQVTGETLTAGSVVVTSTLAGTKGVDTLTVTASIVSGPAYIQPTLAFKESTTAVATASASVATVTPRDTSTVTQATGKFYLYLQAPTTAGTYVVKLTPTGGTNAVATTVSITVTAAVVPGISATASTVAMNTTNCSAGPVWQFGNCIAAGGSGASSYTYAVATDTVTASATLSTVALGTVDGALLASFLLDQKNGASNTMASTIPWTVAITSGPGKISMGARIVSAKSVTESVATTGVDGYQATGTTKSAYFISDGTAGTSVITFTAGGVLVGTRTISVVGAATGYVFGTPTKDVVGVGAAETGSVAITGVDALGTTTGAASVWAFSSDTTIATVNNTQDSTVVITGVKSGTATITVANNATLASATITKTLAIKVGALTAKTVTLSFDNSAPEPGQKVTVSVNAVDASGNPVADGTRALFSSAGLSSSLSVQGATWTASTDVVLKGGKGTFTFYAPTGTGSLTLTATEGTATDSTTKGSISGSITVVNAAADAATDAANEAAAAASDATDAALAAADAADAATVKAQEAVDAVAALSAEVSKLISALKAQITTLTNLVIKIQKKVKA
jgi:hypothetical protein